MRLEARRIIQLDVAGHLGTALLSSPSLCSLNEHRAHALPAPRRQNVPTLDVTDRRADAAFGIPAKACLKESDKLAIFRLCNEPRQIHGAELRLDFFPVILIGAVGPQRTT